MPIAALLSRQTSLSLGMSLGMSLALLSCPGAAQAVGATAHIDWSAVTVDLVDTQPDDAAAFFVPIPQSSWTTCRATGVSSCSPPPLAFPAPYPDTTGRHTAEGPGHSAQTQFLSDQFSASASGIRFV